MHGQKNIKFSYGYDEAEKKTIVKANVKHKFTAVIN